MKKIIGLPMLRLVMLLFILLSVKNAVAQTGEQYVKKMYDRHHSNWYRTLSFTQDTEIYRNDSLIRKSVWYEKARFPWDLRIDVDSVTGGNKIFYLKDSTYRIRNHKIQSVAVDPNPFVFFLGGIYMLPLDSSLSLLTKNNYNLSLATAASWKGRKTFIIGAAAENDSTKNQFWVDAEHLYIVRIQLNMGGALFDVHLSDHVKLGKAWSETKVTFYRNGKLLQVEHYRDLQADVKLEDSWFDVSAFR